MAAGTRRLDSTGAGSFRARPYNPRHSPTALTMPELPEVETTRLGLVPRVVGRRIRGLLVREPRLRWPVPRDLSSRLVGKPVLAIRRRGKYLLFDVGDGHLLVHLGMSGSLTIVPSGSVPRPHDHVDLALDSGEVLRLHDPRRFGAMLWVRDPARHALLARLGVEPLEAGFTGAYLHGRSRGRRVAMKAFLMDSHQVTGVGNIYASEALFAARIHPSRAAGRLSRERCDTLVREVRSTLERAIAAGGSTLRDFVGSDGRPGYFQQQYAVYGRAGEPCPRCGAPVRTTRHGSRATFYCARCQT